MGCDQDSFLFVADPCTSQVVPARKMLSIAPQAQHMAETRAASRVGMFHVKLWSFFRGTMFSKKCGEKHCWRLIPGPHRLTVSGPPKDALIKSKSGRVVSHRAWTSTCDLHF